jgi:hypothetical protein
MDWTFDPMPMRRKVRRFDLLKVTDVDGTSEYLIVSDVVEADDYDGYTIDAIADPTRRDTPKL